jgi:hypothetical protein
MLGLTSPQSTGGTSQPFQTRDQIKATLQGGSFYPSPRTTFLGDGSPGLTSFGLQSGYAGGIDGVQGGSAPVQSGQAWQNSALDAQVEQLYAAQQQPGQQPQQQAAQPGDGQLMQKFTGADLQNEPGYQYGLSESTKTLMNRLNAGGGMYGGAAIKALTKNTNDYASTKYGEAYNRDAADKTRIFNQLSGVAGTGQTASNQVAQAGQFATGNIGNALSSQGDVRASGYLSNANTWGNAINQGISTLGRSNAFSSNPQSISGVPNVNYDPIKEYGGVW